jgi:PilZ domain
MSLSINSFGIERRRECRVTVHLPISVLGTDRSGEQFEVLAHTANLSHRGMAITSHFALDVGTEVDLRILSESADGDRDDAIATPGRIVDIHWDKDIREFIIRIQYRAEGFAFLDSAKAKEESDLLDVPPSAVVK